MEKKYFYVDNLSEYGRKLSCKFNSIHWSFVKLEEGIYCLYNRKTGKIVMSRKHPKDKEYVYAAFAICYHKYMGWAEPKEKHSFVEIVASKLKVGEIFYIAKSLRLPLRCCGHSKNGDVLYEFTEEKSNSIIRLHNITTVYIKKENK